MIDSNATEVHQTFSVPSNRFDALEKAVLKLARKITKGKTSADFPPKLSQVEYIVMVKDGNQDLAPFNAVTVYSKKAQYLEYVQFHLDYQRPTLNGWQLVCIYDWEWANNDVTCYVNPVPGMMVPNEYMNISDGQCDHCRTNRRRKKSMLVTKDFLEFKVVGTSCIKDFLGHKNPQSFIDCYSFEQTLETYVSEFPASTIEIAMIEIEDCLTITNLLVRLNGYVKANDYSGTEPTKYQVSNYLFNDHPDMQKYRTNNPITTNDRETAKDVIFWITKQVNNSEYMDTLQKAVKAGAITTKRLGIMCSAILVYNKAMEKEAAAMVIRSNNHIGKPKDRLDFIGTVKSVRYSPGYYSTVTHINFETLEGDCIHWGASGSKDVEIGEVWTFTATVKDHTVFNGRKQTNVLRTKVHNVDTDALQCAA